MGKLMPSIFPFTLNPSTSELLDKNDLQLMLLDDNRNDITIIDRFFENHQLHNYSQLKNPQKEFLSLLLYSKKDSTLVGAALVELVDQEPYLHSIASNKKGAGTLLMLAISDTLESLGYSSLCLHSAERAFDFYKKLGIKQTNPSRMATPIPLIKYADLQQKLIEQVNPRRYNKI